jgi:formylglycine-generating enzyme required for sulfatase activity
LELKLKTRKLTAQFYPEALTPDSHLEMVFIPGGTFTMGSPDDEPERSDVEGPWFFDTSLMVGYGLSPIVLTC